MSCVLRVKGTNFAVDKFLAESSLKAIAVFRKGEPRAPEASPTGKQFSASGFHVVASEADFSMFQAQIADAIQFLEQNQVELHRLAGYPEVEKI